MGFLILEMTVIVPPIMTITMMTLAVEVVIRHLKEIIMIKFPKTTVTIIMVQMTLMIKDIFQMQVLAKID